MSEKSKTVVAPSDPEIDGCGGGRVREKPSVMPEEVPAKGRPEPVEADWVFAPQRVGVPA